MVGLSSRAEVDANFVSGAWSILPMNTFILVVYLMSLFVELVPSRIMPGHYHDDSSVFLF